MSTICGERNHVYYMWRSNYVYYVEEVIMCLLCGESNYVYYVEKEIMWRK